MPARFAKPAHLSSFRRMAAAMWRAPRDPSIHGTMDIDATNAERVIAEFRAETGLRLTITHLVSHALAAVFARHPELNAKVHLGSRVVMRDTVDLFVSIATDGGKDLSGAKIENADRLSLREWVAALDGSARAIRSGRDESYQRSRDGLRAVPWWALRPALHLIDAVSNELHVHLPAYGLPRDPFGTAVVTNVGSFGIDLAFAPFVPLGRCALLLLLSEIKPRPYVVDGKLEVRPVLRLCATFDHRIVDGFAAGVVARELRALLERPGGEERGEARPPAG